MILISNHFSFIQHEPKLQMLQSSTIEEYVKEIEAEKAAEAEERKQKK